MSCTLNDFTVGQWEAVTLGSHTIEVAPATTTSLLLVGVVYKIDGRFRGFVGDKDSALWWAERELAGKLLGPIPHMGKLQ